ncbi:MAG: cyclodeaminase/cyclohydrolase family protein, partial [Firmicutes bacterium]|nr:cyclodeaminase/cyclohydrolase family protein [Bacillota bacterium]
QTAVTAARVMPLAEKVVQKGNAKAVTDGLVSAMMARTAVRSALVNVRINLESINDTEYVAQMKDKCRDLEGRVVKAVAYILSLVPELSYCKS